MCYGHLIAEGIVAIIRDHIHVSGKTPQETVLNWQKFFQATKRNNKYINKCKENKVLYQEILLNRLHY